MKCQQKHLVSTAVPRNPRTSKSQTWNGCGRQQDIKCAAILSQVCRRLLAMGNNLQVTFSCCWAFCLCDFGTCSIARTQTYISSCIVFMEPQVIYSILSTVYLLCQWNSSSPKCSSLTFELFLAAKGFILRIRFIITSDKIKCSFIIFMYSLLIVDHPKWCWNLKWST